MLFQASSQTIRQAELPRRQRRPGLIAACLLGLGALFQASVASAAEPIVGRWSALEGQWREIVWEPAPGGGFRGSISQAGSFPCGSPAEITRSGDRYWWRLNGSGTSYSGTARLISLSDCSLFNPPQTTLTASLTPEPATLTLCFANVAPGCVKFQRVSTSVSPPVQARAFLRARPGFVAPLRLSGLNLAVSCPAGASSACTGRLAVRTRTRRPLTLGARTFTIPAGTTRTLVLAVPPAARTYVRARAIRSRLPVVAGLQTPFGTRLTGGFISR